MLTLRSKTQKYILIFKKKILMEDRVLFCPLSDGLDFGR